MKTEKLAYIIQRRPKIRAQNQVRWYDWDTHYNNLDDVREELSYWVETAPYDEWRIVKRITTVEETEVN